MCPVSISLHSKSQRDRSSIPRKEVRRDGIPEKVATRSKIPKKVSARDKLNLFYRSSHIFLRKPIEGFVMERIFQLV